MHSDSDSTECPPELHVSFFSDTIAGIRKTIEGLAQLAGLEGLDTVAAKLEEAVEECEVLIKDDSSAYEVSDGINESQRGDEQCSSDQQPQSHGLTLKTTDHGG